MLQWMSTGKKTEQGNKYWGALHISSHPNIHISNANDQFIQHFKDNALNHHNDSSNSFEILLNNSDTGAIGGADADGGSTINHQNAVPDSGPGYDPTPASAQPFGNFGIKWEKEGEASHAPNEDGKQTPFPYNSFTVDDKESSKDKKLCKINSKLLDRDDVMNEQNQR